MQFLDVGTVANRLRDFGTFVGEFDRNAHGFDGNQDVREEDHRIDSEDAQRLKGNLGGQIDVLAEIEEGNLLADVAVFL